MITCRASDSALRSRQFRPVQAQFLAGASDKPRIKIFMRAARWDLCLPPLSMNGHQRRAFLPPLMFMFVEPATVFDEPFPKGRVLHSSLRSFSSSPASLIK